MAANVHPDHDTIATFRRDNLAAFGESFLQVLLLAKELKLVKVGLVSVDGSKFEASASKHRSATYERAGELIDQLKLGHRGSDGGVPRRPTARVRTTPRRCPRRSHAGRPCAIGWMRRVGASRLGPRRAPRPSGRTARPRWRRARRAPAGPRASTRKPPDETPRADEQSNLSDPDSRLMRKSKQHEYRQAYKRSSRGGCRGLSADLWAPGSPTAPATAMSWWRTSRRSRAVLGRPATVLADNGYANGDESRGACRERH